MITSAANPQIKNLGKLVGKAKARREQSLFVVEGEKMFQEMPRELLRQVYVSESYYNRKKDWLKQESFSFEIVEDSIFRAVSDTVTPQGILCVAACMQYSMEDFLEASKPCFLMLEDIQDPGNLGTIIRTSEGTGVTAVIMSKGCVDIYNPKVIRSTMGSIYRVPFLYVDDLAGMVEQMKQYAVPVYAAHLQESMEYDQMNYTEACAFLIGNEGNGLSEEICKKASGTIRIPMQGQLESLNASVAASVLLYEAYRQRRNRNKYESDTTVKN